MKDSVLLELAARWDRDSVTPDVLNGAEDAKLCNAIEKGRRECKRECADTLRVLVKMLGDK